MARKKLKIFIFCVFILIVLLSIVGTPMLWDYYRDVYLIKQLQSPVWTVRCNAATRLGEIGKQEKVVPLLSKLLNDPKYSVRYTVTMVLLGKGKVAEPVLRETLQQSTDKYIRSSILTAMSNFIGYYRQEQANKIFIPILISALDDSYRANADVASVALLHIGKPAIPAVMQVLQKKEWHSRERAIPAMQFIEFIGFNTGEDTTSLLIQILQYPSPYVCQYAIEVLGSKVSVENTEKTKKIFPALRPLLKHPDPGIRMRTVGVLLRAPELIDDIKEVKTCLIGMSNDSDVWRRQMILDYLQTIDKCLKE